MAKKLTFLVKIKYEYVVWCVVIYEIFHWELIESANSRNSIDVKQLIQNKAKHSIRHIEYYINKSQQEYQATLSVIYIVSGSLCCLVAFRLSQWTCVSVYTLAK